MHTIASISQSALMHNLSVVKRYAPNTKIVSMVKANAYGHQFDLITPLLNNSDLLGVSELSEAVKLRQKTALPILLLSGVYSQDELRYASELNCQIVVHHHTQIALIDSAEQAIDVWIKIDTGMNRLGLSAKEYQQCLVKFSVNPLLNVIAVMSHFACADEINHPLNIQQLTQFKQLTDNSNKHSMANSAAILSQIGLFDFVRPGIMLYGASPFTNNDKIRTSLKPVMRLCAPILSIKTLEQGQFVGYGATWTAAKKTTLATIGIGYGDGYPRHAKTGTPVLINNNLCTLVGRVSMDLICVDIGNITANIGDMAILWGDEKLRVETIAKYSDTISYELLSGVSSRVNFISEV